MEARGGGVFVGRVAELDRLERALHAAAAGSGSTVLVGGEAGIGKTRLASELATRARGAGFEVLVGRCLDLVGTELPLQPFAEALRPLGELPSAASQLRLFEETLALLAKRAAADPVLLVLEDLHWADASTLDLVVYLAHNLDGRRALLLTTYRPDEPASTERVQRLADAARRSGSALILRLGPLEREELTALLVARAGSPPPPALTEAIVTRSEGNPFFAEELLAAAVEQGVELPHVLRDLLLQRVARLDRRTQGVLRLAAAAGRDVGYPLLRAAADLPERDVRESLRRAVEQGVLVADHATSSFRFRHALLAEAIYATLLPGEREEAHARLADQLARGEEHAVAAELAPHWEAAGRAAEAFAASVDAAREAEAVFGLAEARAHLERALRLWDEVPGAAGVVRIDLAELCSWAAELAVQTGAAPRAVELGRRAIELVGEGDPLRAALLHERLGRYLHASGSSDAGLAARERAVELVPGQPPSPERAEVLAALGWALMLSWRHEESRAICEQALTLARTVGARRAEARALIVLGVDLAYLGRGDEGFAHLERAVSLAEEHGLPAELLLAYEYLTDVLTMRGRPRESAALAASGVDVLRRYDADQSTLVAGRIEALVAAGEWDEADSVSRAALRVTTDNWPHCRLLSRAELDIGRGAFDDAQGHLEVSLATVREDGRASMRYDVVVSELALWERRWTDATDVVRDSLARARARDAALVRVQLCAQGVRAAVELVALARARRDHDAVRHQLGEARKLVTAARRAAAEAAEVTPTAAAWGAVVEAEYERARGAARPEAWAEAAVAWEGLDRLPLAAYCRWREAEALVAAGATRADAAVPLREAHAVAARIGARPLLRELELLAERARLELAPPEATPRARHDLEVLLGLTPREAEVLTLLARGLTNREIANALVISVKTANVHVSHILRKLDAPNRVEAAAIAHRLSPRSTAQTLDV
jgi:DNA-binding CsgD family transcriptional regulator